MEVLDVQQASSYLYNSDFGTRLIGFLTDKYGLYLEGFKFTSMKIAIYSYRKRRIFFINGKEGLEMFTPRDRCSLLELLKKKNYAPSDKLIKIMGKYFPCQLQKEFWAKARLVWIGHYKNETSPFSRLPPELICCILDYLRGQMSVEHGLSNKI